MYNEDKRNQIGMVLFFIASTIIGIILLPFMIGRELYQYNIYKLYGMPFEWNDIFTYGLWILIGSFFHYFLVDYFFTNVPLIFYF